jgi:Domain of unknown function (DUF4419)
MAHTFQVGSQPISEWFKPSAAKPWQLDRQVQKKLKGETLYASEGETVGGTSPLFHAISYAFNNHCPIVLTPDSVWLTILTGLTHHIDADPEKMRRHFVTHEGKKELVVLVEAPSIRLCSREIWEFGIRGFSGLLKENLNPKRHELIISNFSTTTETDRLASQVSLMGAMKHWFDYKMMLCCGMTKVTVSGTPEDWSNIIDRVSVLSEFDLSWWTVPLLPVLRHIKAASEGRPDVDFWKRAYLSHSVGSGGDYNVSGWINAFYPYIAGGRQGTMQRNPHVAWESVTGEEGIDPDDFPFGLSAVPVKIDDHGTEYDCEFYGGLVGVQMSATDYEVKPVSGISIQLLGLTGGDPAATP